MVHVSPRRSVKGLHLNFVMLPPGGLGRLKSLLIGRYAPWLVGLTREDVRLLYPYMEKNVFRILRETGYFHIQATKPDTIGIGRVIDGQRFWGVMVDPLGCCWVWLSGRLVVNHELRIHNQKEHNKESYCSHSGVLGKNILKRHFCAPAL